MSRLKLVLLSDLTFDNLVYNLELNKIYYNRFDHGVKVDGVVFKPRSYISRLKDMINDTTKRSYI